MKKILELILIAITIISCNQIKEQESFKIKGTIDQTLKVEEVILVTQTNEIQDTIRINSNNFEFSGKVSEPSNAAIILNGKMWKFPLVNDKIEIKVLNPDNKKFEINYKNSQVNNNLRTYFDKESKDYINKYKLFEEQKVKSENKELKYEVTISEDSLAANFVQQLIDKYKITPDKSGLSIILSDLTGLIGTRNYPDEIEKFFKLLPINEQNGFYGNKIKSYLAQSFKIALGQKINFDFIDINKKSYTLSEFQGKLILLEFWASWCGPCVSQIPILKKIAENSDKIQLISISIDEDLSKWSNKVQDLKMDWINIHFKQRNNDLKNDFFITGVPFNILVSQEGKILKKNISMNELLEFLN